MNEESRETTRCLLKAVTRAPDPCTAMLFWCRVPNFRLVTWISGRVHGSLEIMLRIQIHTYKLPVRPVKTLGGARLARSPADHPPSHRGCPCPGDTMQPPAISDLDRTHRPSQHRRVLSRPAPNPRYLMFTFISAEPNIAVRLRRRSELSVHWEHLKGAQQGTSQPRTLSQRHNMPKVILLFVAFELSRCNTTTTHDGTHNRRTSGEQQGTSTCQLGLRQNSLLHPAGSLFIMSSLGRSR
jgi:hypothetical protein